MKIDVTLVDILADYRDKLSRKFGQEFNLTGGFTIESDGNGGLKEVPSKDLMKEHYIRFNTRA